MLSLYAHTKFAGDHEELLLRFDTLMRRGMLKATNSERKVKSQDWSLVASSEDGSWENYESPIIAVSPRRGKSPVLGTMTVRVYHPLEESR